jgi:hypothetical protein
MPRSEYSNFCLLTESLLVRELVRNVVIQKTGVDCDTFDTLSDFLDCQFTKPPAGVFLDLKATNKQPKVLIETMLRHPYLAQAPLCIIYSYPFEVFAKDVCDDFDSVVHLPKPIDQLTLSRFCTEAIEGRLAPFHPINLKIPMTETLNQRIQTVPGIVQSFTWTEQGTVQNYPTPEARELGDVLSYTVQICSKITEVANFGDLIEIHVLGKEQGSALFSVTNTQPKAKPGDFTMIGVLVDNQFTTENVVQSVRKLVNTAV